MSTTVLTDGIGLHYDPIPEAAQHGIHVALDPDASDLGEYDPETRTIKVRWLQDEAYLRSTVAFQLAYAVLPQPTLIDAIEFAAERLIHDEDLAAISSVTCDRSLWARVLRVRECMLLSHLAVLQGLPVAFPVADAA